MYGASHIAGRSHLSLIGAEVRLRRNPPSAVSTRALAARASTASAVATLSSIQLEEGGATDGFEVWLWIGLSRVLIVELEQTPDGWFPVATQIAAVR